MVKFHRAYVAAVLLAGLMSPAFAQTATTTPAQPAAAAQSAKDPNEMVCVREQVLGSRLGSKKICRTRAEWADQRLQDRQELERVQMRRGAKGE